MSLKSKFSFICKTSDHKITKYYKEMCGLNIALCCRVKLEDMGFANVGLIKCKGLLQLVFPVVLSEG